MCWGGEAGEGKEGCSACVVVCVSLCLSASSKRHYVIINELS